jgi:hypothetical protein
MKNTLCTLLAVSHFAISPASSAVIAYWDFNNGYSSPDNSVQIIHTASSGDGTLFQQRADTDGNGKTGNAYADSANGLNSAAGVAMAWNDIAKSGDNDAELFITFSTLNLTNLVLSFDLRGNIAIIPSLDLKYALTPLQDVINPPSVTGTIKDFTGGLSTEIFNNFSVSAVDSFQRVTLDLSLITALDNQAFVALRLDDFDTGTGNNDVRIDNLLITAIPEPSVTMFGFISLFAWLRRRK